LRSFRLWLFFIVLFMFTGDQYAKAADGGREPLIRNWEIQWIRDDGANRDRPLEDAEAWLAAAAGQLSRMPADATGVWVRVRIPPTDAWRQPALLINRLFGRELSVYADGKLLHESSRSVRFDVGKLFLPLPADADPASLLIRITEAEERAGVYSTIRIGEFAALSAGYIRAEMPDMALGSGMLLLGLIMLGCTGFLTRSVRKFWLSLTVIALSAGTLVITYSPLPYMLFEPQTMWLPVAFDIALFVSAPAFMYFADTVFQGQYAFFTRLRHVTGGYAVLCFLMLGLYIWMPGRFGPGYELVTASILGLLMLAVFVVTAVLAVAVTIRGNWHGAALSGGIFALTTAAAVDLAMYYLRDAPYDPILWKFGTLALLVALIIILSAKIARDHAAIIAYAKEREDYNRRLQRAEKLKIISDLAASVAHEVRNPLQVTRGFLQLLAERELSNRQYYKMAIEELDRASSIITDFLTFAKPELEEFTVLDIAEELDKINAIMTPHASLNGVSLRFDVQNAVRIEGNSSRFKQAIINFIKNGIEAMDSGGEINIRAFRQDDDAVIRIRDNGSGMDEEQLAKLGTPYYSTKTKGTGLGLMVTFRIIEAMNGTISFDSEIGKGTEVTLRFPIVRPE
jgi:Signal transduction histidine kinase